LRCLTRRGINISGLSLGLGRRLGGGGLGSRGLGLLGRGRVAVATTAAGAGGTVVAVATRATTTRSGGRLLRRELLLGHVALVDPDLDADAPEGRAGLVEAVVDVRAKGVQRHPTLTVELGTGHLGAAETTGALDPDALGAGTQ